jgi:hypothetical protein
LQTLRQKHGNKSGSDKAEAWWSCTDLMAVLTLSLGGGDTLCASSCVVDPKRDMSSFTLSTVFSSGMRMISASSNAGMHFS